MSRIGRWLPPMLIAGILVLLTATAPVGPDDEGKNNMLDWSASDLLDEALRVGETMETMSISTMLKESIDGVVQETRYFDVQSGSDSYTRIILADGRVRETLTFQGKDYTRNSMEESWYLSKIHEFVSLSQRESRFVSKIYGLSLPRLDDFVVVGEEVVEGGPAVHISGRLMTPESSTAVEFWIGMLNFRIFRFEREDRFQMGRTYVRNEVRTYFGFGEPMGLPDPTS